MDFSSSALGMRLSTTACGLLILCLGCGGGSEVSLEPYEGTRVLPTTRSIPHPDSVQEVKLVQRPDSVAIILNQSYADLTKKWSAQLRRGAYDDALRPGPFNSYATLWSLEVRLAQLERQGTSTLSPDQARQQIEKTLEAHRETVAFDLNLFVDPQSDGTPLSLLRQSVNAQLAINDDRVYSATRTQQAAVDRLRRTGETIYHYRITVHFPRQQDGTDILQGAEQIEVSTRPFHSTARLSFQWRMQG